MLSTTPQSFIDGYRLIDGTELNDKLGNPQWSTTTSVTATAGGNVNTSIKVVDAITNITSAAPNSGITIPQALPGKVLVVSNSTLNGVVVYAAGDSTISGIPGNIGIVLPGLQTLYVFAVDTKQWMVSYSLPAQLSANTVATDLPLLQPSAGQVVNVAGYYAIGDGGGGQFYAVVGAPVGTYVDNGGTIILPFGGNGSSAWLRIVTNVIAAKWFGAVGNGIADDTLKLSNMFNYAVPLAIPMALEGSYLVTGPILPSIPLTDGSVHIICNGNVKITVDAGSTGFRNLIYVETTNVNNCSITGGSLSINCNNKAATAIGFRHNALTQGGVVNIECPVEILNCYNTDATSTYENYGIFVYGDYQTVVINQPRVVGLSRAAATGACKGISVSAFTGEVTINQPYVKDVLIGGGTTDADGLAVFGKYLGSTYGARPGKVNINEPTFVDCQGRAIKLQCSDVTIYRPRIFRQYVVGYANSTDIDSQYGGQTLIVEPYFDYRLNGATSPLGASHSCIAFQQVLDNRENDGRSLGGTLVTEVLVPRYCLLVHQATALQSYQEVNGLVVQAIGVLTTKAIDRAVIEFSAATVEAKSTTTTIVLKNCSGPIGTVGIGYTGYTGTSLAAKLSVTAINNNSSITTPISRILSNLGGSAIVQVKDFKFFGNANFSNLMSTGWTFDFAQLSAGNQFTIDIATSVVTNAPGWGTGYALIECLETWIAGTTQCRVTVGNASAANTVFYTSGGAVPTWGTIK